MSTFNNTWLPSQDEVVTETVEEFDGDGKLVKRTVTKTERKAGRNYEYPNTPPYQPYPYIATF